MRYEVLIMMAVVGAINVIGRIMAKRAKARLAAEQSQAVESSAEPQPIAPRRTAVVKEPIRAPVRETMRVAARATMLGVAQVPKREMAPLPKIPAFSAGASVGSPVAAVVAQAKVAKAVPVPAQKRRTGWSARRLRDGLVATEILGPPVSLRG